MKSVLKVAVAATLVFAATAPAYAFEVPKSESAPVIKASAPGDHTLKFGKKKPKFMSEKQTSWVCFTPAGTCFVPFLGGCCCVFWNGQWCGST